MELEDYGYNQHFLAALEQIGDTGLRPGRVVLASREAHRVVTRDGEHRARVSGRLRHEAGSAADLPAVGDWVALRDSRIETVSVAPHAAVHARSRVGGRSSRLSQPMSTRSSSSWGLDGDFNPRRLERYLTTVWESGAAPAVLLNKADLVEALDIRKAEIEQIAVGAPSVGLELPRRVRPRRSEGVASAS